MSSKSPRKCSSDASAFLLDEFLILAELSSDEIWMNATYDIDEKLSKALGYSETIMNHSTSASERHALCSIIFHPQRLSTLDKKTVHCLFLNLFKTYRWWTKERIAEHLKDTMSDITISPADMALMQRSIDIMKAKVKQRSFSPVKKTPPPKGIFANLFKNKKKPVK